MQNSDVLKREAITTSLFKFSSYSR